MKLHSIYVRHAACYPPVLFSRHSAVSSRSISINVKLLLRIGICSIIQHIR